MNKFRRSCFSLCLAFCLCVGFLLTDSIKVYAYENEDNFYVLDLELNFNFDTSSGFYHIPHLAASNGVYKLNNEIIYDIQTLSIFNSEDNEQWTFPFNGEVYDYYFLGTITGVSEDRTLSTFKPTNLVLAGWDYDNNWSFGYNLSKTVIYDVDSQNRYGFGFYTKVDFNSAKNIGINHIYLDGDIHGTGNKPANLVAEFGILAVEKGSSESQIMGQILSKLSQMESSINSSIGNAADKVTDSIEDQYQVDENENFGVEDIQQQVEQKLGVLNFGADTLVGFLDLFSSSNAGNTVITFPGFSMTIQGVKYQIWNDIDFDLKVIEDNFGILITAVRTMTVLSVWLAVLGYLVKAKDQLINNRG